MGAARKEVAREESSTHVTKYVISKDAEADLDGIWEYIASDSTEAADRWASQLRSAIELIARNPGLGHTRKDLTAYPVLFWPVGSYLVIYRLQNDLVEIVAVTQGARDIPSFLRRRAEN